MGITTSIRGTALALAMSVPSVAAVGGYVSGGSSVGCTPSARAEAKAIADDVLSAGDIACLLGPMIDPELPEVAMEACKLAPRVRPIVDRLLSQKLAAAKAGACGGDAGR